MQGSEAVQPPAELELRPPHLRLWPLPHRRPGVRPRRHAHRVRRNEVVQGAGGHAQREG